jgi:hypothetical protein
MANAPTNIEIPMQILVAERESLPLWEYMHAAKVGTLEEFIGLLNFLGKEGWQFCQRIDSVNYLMIRQIIPETEVEEAERLKRERYADVRAKRFDEEPGE